MIGLADLYAGDSDTVTVGWGKTKAGNYGPVIIEDSTNYTACRLNYFGTNRVMVLPDSNSTLDIHAVMTPERQAQFRPYSREVTWDTPGITNYWLKAEIKNISNSELFFWFRAYAPKFWFYGEDSTGAIIPQTGGYNFPYDAEKKYYPKFNAPLRMAHIHIKALEVCTIYWQMEIPSWFKHHKTSLSGTLIADEYHKRIEDRQISWRKHSPFVNGMIAAITIFLLIFYTVYREISFFALAMLSLSCLFWILHTDGLSHTTIFASLSVQRQLSVHVTSFLNLSRVYAAVVFAITFLELRSNSPGWYRTLLWLALGLSGIIAIDIVSRWIMMTNFHSFHSILLDAHTYFGAIFSGMYLLMGIHLTLRKVPMAGFFLLSIFFLTGIEILRSPFLSFLLNEALVPVDRSLGTALMLLSFSTALAYRMRLIERGKQLAETEVIRIDADLNAATELDALKTSFFTSISHEFRTPLTLIVGPLEKLRDFPNQKNIKPQIEMVLRNATRMQNLITQLLDLAKIQSSKIQLKVSEHNFSKHIKTISAAHESLAESNEIQFITNFTEEELTLYYDREMMNKIVNNLISNAFKYCTPGGDVIVSLVSNDDSVELQVENSGEPISQLDQERIFDHFQRIESSSEQIEGSGVGLSLTKDLIGLHHAEIRVRSDPGENIRFTAKFQLGRNHFKTEDIVIASEDHSPDSIEVDHFSGMDAEEITEPVSEEDQHQILIVEDNADMRSFIADELADIYSISTAVNGRLGFEIARENIPDLIISDVMMPEMDGFTLLEKTRQDPLLCHIPIIMLTALSTDEAKFKGLETGADDYLLKPFNTRELRIRVSNLIRQRHRLRKRFTLDQAQNLKEVTVSSMDEKFLHNIMRSIDINMSDMEFGVKQLSEQVYMSRSQLFRKLNALTNLSPTDFIRTQRLKRAASLLEQHSGNVTEIAFEVGFQNSAYFAKCFKKEYGVLPSKYSPSS